VRRRLVSEFGRPASFFDRGQFSPALASDLSAERFIRITEWDLPEGVLRFGIPRRLDGVVRMELQFARGFPDPQRSDWSLDSVR